jgi:NAD-dependent deacetylase
MAKVVIFTGAGISAESGIPTFRDRNGLWENYSIEDICESGCLEKDRKKVIDFYNMLRTQLKDKEPNYAHRVIASLKKEFTNDIVVVTQNVDDMFEKAGCEVTHLHGFLKEIRCEECDYEVNIDYKKQDINTKCPRCNCKLRPNIVFFGESAPAYMVNAFELQDCKMIVVIGTSGLVISPDLMLNNSIDISILNNLEPSEFINDKLYTKVLYKKASEAIDEISNDIRIFLKKVD